MKQHSNAQTAPVIPSSAQFPMFGEASTLGRTISCHLTQRVGPVWALS